MSKLLATDLDGTLFYPKKLSRCISKKNVKFLQEFIDAGNKLVLVTSRSDTFTLKLKDEIQRPFDCICNTSSIIYANGEKIRDVTIDRESLKAVIHFLDEKIKPKGYVITTRNNELVVKNCGNTSKLFLFFYKIWWWSQFKYRENIIVSNEVFDDEIEHGDVYKVLVFYGFGRSKKKFSKEVNKLLRESYPDIESSWSSIVNELTPAHCNKGVGLQYYQEHLNVNKDDIYVIGDSGNDITMFNKFYENSFCMKHAFPSAKKYAKHYVSRVFKLKKYVLKGENK